MRQYGAFARANGNFLSRVVGVVYHLRRPASVAGLEADFNANGPEISFLRRKAAGPVIDPPAPGQPEARFGPCGKQRAAGRLCLLRKGTA